LLGSIESSEFIESVEFVELIEFVGCWEAKPNAITKTPQLNGAAPAAIQRGRRGRRKGKTRKKAGGFINQELFPSPFQSFRDNTVADPKVFPSEVFNKRPDPVK
jgi:hypothetical protein